MPVALGEPVLGSLVAPGSDHGGRLGLDELLEDPFEAGADPLVEFARFERAEQLGQVRLGKGTVFSSRCSCRNTSRITPVAP